MRGKVEVVKGGFHGEGGQQVGDGDDQALGVHPDSRRERPCRRPYGSLRGLRPLLDKDLVRVGRRRPTHKLGVPGSLRRTRLVPAPVADEVDCGLLVRRAGQGDQRALGIEEQMKEEIADAPALAAGGPVEGRVG